jgi:RNA polymerase II-associated factor 1
MQTPTTFHFVRDYEVVKVEQDVPNEFVIMIDDGAAAEDLYGEATAPRRRRGAYYKGLERKMQLKKKRGQEAYADKWDVVHVQHAPMSAEEADERAETRAEVVDPLYLTRLAAGADRDADGEADAEGEPDQDAEADMDESALVRDRLVANGFDDAVDVVGGA